MKRIFLFVVTNLAVLLVLGIVTHLLGVGPILTQRGIDYPSLFVFAAVWGMGGSLISLLISRWSAKHMTRARVITQPADPTERWLVETVRALATRRGLPMPQVAIYPGPPNAFATGPSRNRSLVAVSTGLLQQMSPTEVEGVLAHELGHVGNGDMVTLTLLQGVLNTFVIAGSWIIGYAVDAAMRSKDSRERGASFGFFLGRMIAQILLGIVASLIVMAYSRKREFAADLDAARTAGRDRMIAALERLRSQHPSELPASLAAFGINGKREGGWKRLFLTHPPIEERIAALRRATL